MEAAGDEAAEAARGRRVLVRVQRQRVETAAEIARISSLEILALPRVNTAPGRRCSAYSTRLTAVPGTTRCLPDL
ncbi:hypothetical protein SSP24_50410 [Streptomyces spinoverrucosus]|uniref:Uncharacterized protein n=1 Tax=Streptomyces spinoverrucosus TaxID=284043 RepID=A0A4Y3VQZ3_9ACTN|nr:hypothetical protein SSP24_50410 [Streptomyces spinoverrucosus]GHB54949.1 hypothetical protein GCM10010397_26640 [Streptomyces spinoverrucosus]